MHAPLLLALVALLGPQENPYDRFLRRLSSAYPDVEESRRRALARALAEGVDRAAAFGHPAGDLLEIVESKLAPRNAAQEQALALGEQIKPWIEDGPARLTIPDGFSARQRDATFALAEQYLSEVAARRSATEAEKDVIRRQMGQVRDEIRAAARTKVLGPYGSAVLERSLQAVFDDQTGEDLGNALLGAVTRPLTDEEMAQVVRRVREEAAKVEPVQAVSEDDRLYSETGEVVVGVDAPAMRLSTRLANLLYSFGELNYPKTARAAREQGQAMAEAAEWLKVEWELIAKELERKEPLKTYVKPDARPLAPPRPGAMSTASDAPARSKPVPGASTSTGERSRPYWVTGLLLAMAVAIGLWIWSRHGRRLSRGSSPRDANA